MPTAALPLRRGNQTSQRGVLRFTGRSPGGPDGRCVQDDDAYSYVIPVLRSFFSVLIGFCQAIARLVPTPATSSPWRQRVETADASAKGTWTNRSLGSAQPHSNASLRCVRVPTFERNKTTKRRMAKVNENEHPLWVGPYYGGPATRRLVKTPWTI